ncbi:MAG: pentapeptide repeat-containing protein [Methylocella sp.]
MTHRRKSLFSNTLVLPYFDALEAAKIDDPKKLDWIKHTLVLRGRHLEEAYFDGADLDKADLEGAQLQGARLIGAQLQGASLEGAQLQGAALADAQLQGASLNNAQLQGAWLNAARLQGASLDYAHLQGAELHSAQLQGARLFLGQLQGVSLVAAQLQGASLEGAQLQGADFRGSAPTGTNMGGVKIWRTNFVEATLKAIFEDDLKESAILKNEFAALRSAIKKEVPESEQREELLKRIEKLNPDIFGPEASEHDTLEKGRVDKAGYQKALTDQLKGLACRGDESASYVVRGPALRSGLGFLVVGAQITPIGARILEAGPFAQDLIESILAPDCPVSGTLTEQDKAELRELAKEAQASDGKQ